MAQQPLVIGISCYPTFGGSGVIATEIGMEMAKRGHRVHIISYAVPIRLNRFMENIYFHEVEVTSYPLFEYPPYDLALASKMVEVCEQQQLDVLHVHYAIPHAVSAFLAKQILKEKAPKVMTTLHGTDITLVGNDRSYLPISRLSILESDVVTAVSQYLRQATYDKLAIPTQKPIEVIPNFVNLEEFTCKKERIDLVRSHLCRSSTNKRMPVLCHVSNFRPVKRIEDVIKTFALVRKEMECVLVLVGDGPERSRMEALARELKVERCVSFLGKQTSVSEILSSSDVFIMTSQTESFGLGALEAMACGVPVVSTKVGGVPEVIEHGKNGFLAELGNTEELASYVLKLLRDEKLRGAMSAAARETAESKFEISSVVNQYEALYYKLCNR